MLATFSLRLACGLSGALLLLPAALVNPRFFRVQFWTILGLLVVPARGTLEADTVVWLCLRWGLGFVGPLILSGMAYEAARIRSTQSATGILYVVVIFCFLGELTSQLLLASPAVPPFPSTVLNRE